MEKPKLILRVGNIWVDIVGEIPAAKKEKLREKLRQKLSFRPQGYQFNPYFSARHKTSDGSKGRRVWDGWKRQFWSNTRRTYFPTGLYSLVSEYLQENNITYAVQDIRQQPEPNIEIVNEGFQYRDYQEDIINEACDRSRGIIQVSTGGGKTIIGSGIISKLKVCPFIFFVTSRDLLQQAKESMEFALRLDGRPVKVGQIGGGIIDIQDINVCTVQTAVRALGKKWDKKYKFDTEDSNDDTPIGKHRDEIKKVLQEAKGAICDECLSGDSLVTTRTGKVKIKHLKNYIGKDILSYSYNSVVWRKVTNFYPKGKKRTLLITLLNGDSVTCTEDHPIMTNRGWIEAGKITSEDQILCHASAVVANKSMLEEEAPANTPDTSLDTKLKNEHFPSGKKSLKTQLRAPHCASVAAASRSGYTMELLNLLLNTEVVVTTGLSTDTTSARIFGGLNCPVKKSKPFWELYLGILRLPFHLNAAKTQDSTVIMDYHNRNGRYLSRTFYQDYLQDIDFTKTVDMEIAWLRSEHLATKSLIGSIKLHSTKDENVLPKTGSMPLATLDCPGGYVTMGIAEQTLSNCILKDSQKTKSKSLANGLTKTSALHQCITQKTNTIPFISRNKPEIKSFQKSKITSRNVCNTNYVGIKSICHGDEIDVFDISVDDTHCFFANNILVHNCQHWRADTCQLVTRELKSAFYRFGLSATPYRDEGDDMLIQACFGKKIAQISASELIEKGWLVDTHIKIVHIHNRKTKYRQWQSIYKDRVAEDDFYNGAIANIANAFINDNRLALVLVQQINHGKHLASMIKGAQFLSGSSTKKKRETGLRNLRNKYISCIVSTSLPYEELLLIKQNGIIRQIEIGELCTQLQNQPIPDQLDVLCSVDGKTGCWRPITAVHKHKRQNRLVRVRTNRHEDICVTENHSLVDSSLKPVLPKCNADACSPKGVPRGKKVDSLDLVELLSKYNDDTIEIEIINLTHSRIRKLKSELNYLTNKKISDSTRSAVRKRLLNINNLDTYKNTLEEIFYNFSYYKRRYRAKLSSVKNKNIFRYFECRIYIRRSRKRFYLPITLPVSESLALISGLMCGDGHIKHHVKGKSCRSIYAFDFAGLKDMSSSYEGRYDVNKRGIRDIFIECFTNVFGQYSLFQNSRHIRFRSKLMYYLFHALGHLDKNGNKRVPDYVYNSSRSVQESFLYGLYLSDGSLNINYKKLSKTGESKSSAIAIHNTSRPLIVGIANILEMLHIDYYMYSIDPKPPARRRYSIYMKNSLGRIDLDMHRNRDKLDYTTSFRKQEIVDFLDRNDEFVYDISVREAENFVAGRVLAHNTIFDEGIDVKPLDTVILAGQGKSRTRAMQRVGRITRPYPNPQENQKKKAVAIDFRIHDKYLEDHSVEREKMYRTEPRYKIEHIDPEGEIR